MSEIKISDEEWKKFLDEVYSHVVYEKPTKDATEKYLNWKQSKDN